MLSSQKCNVTNHGFAQNFFFFIHLSLELVGEKKQKDQAKIQFESKLRTPNQDL